MTSEWIIWVVVWVMLIWYKSYQKMSYHFVQCIVQNMFWQFGAVCFSISVILHEIIYVYHIYVNMSHCLFIESLVISTSDIDMHASSIVQCTQAKIPWPILHDTCWWSLYHMIRPTCALWEIWQHYTPPVRTHICSLEHCTVACSNIYINLPSACTVHLVSTIGSNIPI